LDPLERLGEIDGFFVGSQEGRAIRALAQMSFEGRKNIWLQPPRQVVGDQRYFVFAGVLWWIGPLRFWLGLQ
jgi:hypothetical protein